MSRSNATAWARDDVLLSRSRHTSLLGDILSYSSMIATFVHKKKEHEDFKPSLPPRVRCQFKERRLFSFSSFLFSLFTLCTFAVFLLELRKEGNALFFYASLSALVLSYLGRAFCIYGLRKDMKEGRTTGFLMGAAAYLFDPKCGQYLLRPHLRDKQLQSSKYWMVCRARSKLK